MECMRVWGSSKSGIVEVEPISSCVPSYLPDTSPLLQGNNRVVLGHFNQSFSELSTPSNDRLPEKEFRGIDDAAVLINPAARKLLAICLSPHQ